MSAPTNAATAAASAPNVTKPPNSAAVATSTTAKTSATASHTIATGITSYSENALLSFSVVHHGFEQCGVPPPRPSTLPSHLSGGGISSRDRECGHDAG